MSQYTDYLRGLPTGELTQVYDNLSYRTDALRSLIDKHGIYDSYEVRTLFEVNLHRVACATEINRRISLANKTAEGHV